MKQKTFREKLLLFARKAGGWSFLIAMAGAVASTVWSPAGILFPVFFASAFLCFGLMFLPGAFAPFHWPNLAICLCLTGAGVSIALLFTGMAMKIPMKSGFMQGAGYLFMFALFSGFAGMIGSGGSDPATKTELKDAMESAAKKLGLTFKDNSAPRMLDLQATGENLTLGIRRGGGAVTTAKSRRGRTSAPTSSIIFTPHIPPTPVKILCTHGVVDITGADSLRTDKLEGFIKHKDLKEYDFSLTAQGKDVALQVSVAIEEDDLWVDFADLCKIAGS